jgi:hypothetical protein
MRLLSVTGIRASAPAENPVRRQAMGRHDEAMSGFSRPDAPDPRLDRVLREAGDRDLLTALAERLSPADLSTLLLAVYRRRAGAVTPARLLARYERSRFAAPSTLDPADLARLDVLLHATLAGHGFTGVELSPVCPLGTNAAVATVDQNKVLTTVRDSEVVADATNVLALECAVRRRTLLRAAPRTRERIRLGATHRVVRTQAFGPGMMAHFRLFGVCTAGRDEGSFRFETAALAEQIGLHLDVLAQARVRGHPIGAVRVSLTDLSAGRHRAALDERVLDALAAVHPDTAFGFDDERAGGRGYYTGACFDIAATAPDGEVVSLVDGGLTSWTARLLSNAKERLLISGLGVERLCDRFPLAGHAMT